MFTGSGLVAFCCIFAPGLAGLALGRILPQDQASEATHKAVQLTMSVVGLLAALVLGLLVASAKSSLDTSSKEVEQFGTSLVLLDRDAVHLGSEAVPVRALLRAFTEEKITQTWTQTWTEDPAAADHSRTVKLLEDIQARVRAFVPQTDTEREARTSSLRLIDDIKQNSRLLAVQQSRHVPRFFLIVVVFWLGVLFFSYGVFSPPNAVVIAAMVIAAFSVSAAVNLIIDMDHPFAGYIAVSKVPMQQALDSMTR